MRNCFVLSRLHQILTVKPLDTCCPPLEGSACLVIRFRIEIGTQVRGHEPAPRKSASLRASPRQVPVECLAKKQSVEPMSTKLDDQLQREGVRQACRTKSLGGIE